jgi:lipopolysaccharide/colanic/teichoic acid biosynthesis glycosyltransferase/glycosyltransferase involved in cell wall biosynthesis
MRVAHLTTVDTSLRYLVLPQLLAVLDEGGEAIGISATGPCVEELGRMGVRHLHLRSSTRGISPMADLRAALELWRILRREEIDVLHTHNPKPGIYGRILGRLAGVPVVVNTVHGLYATEDDRLLKRAIVYALEALAARFSDAELVQSREDYELLTRRRITRRSRTHLLGNGVDLTRFDSARFSDGQRALIRRSLGIAPDRVVVGMVGRLVEEKGYPELFEAAARLDDRHLILVAGHDDPDKPDALSHEAIKRAEAMGVRFLGMRDDLEKLYSAMDIFVLPSHREGLPRGAMEAAAMGLPIVATNIRGCREVVQHGVNGLLIPVGNSAELAQSIRTLGEDPTLRSRMGRAGRLRAIERFDEREVVRIVTETYRRAGARKGLSFPAKASPRGVPRGESSSSRRAGRPPKPGRAKGWMSRGVKRVVDVSLSVLGLVVVSPLLAAFALLIRLTLREKALFVQPRVGLNGEVFSLYKFRTMRTLRDAEGRLLPDEQRLTRLGRLLRSTSLDELPELFNVLKGDMSLVGPRPLLVDYLPLYTPDQARRHEVKPGITGWVQVNGRNRLTWEEKFEFDLWYVDNRSLLLDLKILALTLVHVAQRRGISQEGHATMPSFRGPSSGTQPTTQRANEAG